ncbi:hypothetical protein KVT40_004473 [Elsinoe batatas]|uniref:Fe2OG dioxygenase domain-containing protein n=1 Tax=Elsinoe batatas TaxID=2601811 RepID=A0A8K0L6W9_9PEZI|nr:hypothetical protein KVT40_004473 [Elsinoe batatas]
MHATPVPFSIPVIDISGYPSSPTHTTQIITQLRTACHSPGFFQITGHSVPLSLRAAMLTQTAAFYRLPMETKAALDTKNSPCFRGYERLGVQKLEPGFDDMKEGFMISNERPDSTRFLQGSNQWPEERDVPGFRETFEAYFEAVRGLSRTMFRLMALTLGLEEGAFDGFVDGDDAIQMCRAHRYPPTTLEAAERTRGIGAHTDFGAMTLLMQDDIGGLEVFHKPTQTWHPVTPVRDAFVVNIGDMMERWTNGKYTSTLHRVTRPVSDKDRYSVVFFNEGPLDQVIECLPTCLEPGEKPLNPPVRVEDHLRMRWAKSL